VATELPVLIEELPNYILDVKSKHSENAKAFSFSSFIQKVYGIPTEDLDLEVPVKSTVRKLKGRVDAIFGNLIIEFKKDLESEIEDAEYKLSKYLLAYHESQPNVRYVGIANDGTHFVVYLPVFQNDTTFSLELIDQYND